MDASMRLNRSVGACYGVTPASSHALASGDRGQLKALRTKPIEATVPAIAAGSDPRLGGTGNTLGAA